MNNLKDTIKSLIIDALDLEDITTEEIDSDAPLFGEGLGLDSIDALELGIAIKKKFDVSFPDDKAENQKHFASVNALADFIGAHQS